MHNVIDGLRCPEMSKPAEVDVIASLRADVSRLEGELQEAKAAAYCVDGHFAVYWRKATEQAEAEIERLRNALADVRHRAGIERGVNDIFDAANAALMVDAREPEAYATHHLSLGRSMNETLNRFGPGGGEGGRSEEVRSDGR
jgi:hypothetical protein